MKTYLATFIALIISSVTLHAYALSIHQPLTAPGTVVRVIDGDTYDVRIDDAAAYQAFIDDARGDNRRERYVRERATTIRVRLANVDTEESVHSDPSRNTAKGRESSKAVTRLIQNKPVVVRCHDWGYYGRSICNVSFDLSGQSTDLGHWLIVNGHSEYVSRWGKNPYLHNQYTAAQRAQ